MVDKGRRLEKEVTTRLTFLVERYGFCPPVVNRDRWSTTISVLSKDIAIEVELDWRDLDVFMLVTALEGGKLPDGYYVSSGKRCRVYIENILKTKPSFKDSSIVLLQQHRRSNKCEGRMLKQLDAYIELLEKYISPILALGLRLFE